MTYDSIHPAFRGMLACFEALRRLGYPADDIHFYYVAGIAFTQLRVGDRTIDFDCGEYGTDVDTREAARQFAREWRKVMRAVRDCSLDDETFMRIWLESWPYNHADDFAASLINAGFIPPTVSTQ